MYINAFRSFCVLTAIMFVLIFGAGNAGACVALADDGSFDCAGYTASSGGCSSSEYLDSLCVTESGCNYNCAQSGGLDDALGRYQFIPGTRQGLCQSNSNLPCVSAAAFANCPALQDAYINTFNEQNISALKNCGAWDKIGSTIGGTEVTESCLLAAAHLGGAGGACSFTNGGNSCDQLGTCLSDYCDKHGGYDITPGSGSGGGGEECEIPEEEEDDTEIPPVAACGMGPGVAVCEMPPCSIGTPTGFCVPVTPTPPPSDDDEEEEEHEHDEDEDVCETDGIPYELQGGGAANGMPATGSLTCENLDQICTSPDGVELDIPNQLLQDIVSIQGCMQGKGYSAETLYLNSCARTPEHDAARGSTVTNSQHHHGTAMDFSFSGVGTGGIDDLHACAGTERDSHGHGGVGIYGSGFPYIHYDVRESTADWDWR